MQISLSGRTAIITGGSRGLGYATASQMVRSGASVAIVARGQADLDKAQKDLTKLASTARSSARVGAYSCDVSVGEQRQATFEKIKKDFGHVDILLNNAGEGAARPFEDVDAKAWQADMDLKFMAAVHLSQLCWPDMKERKWGRIINTLNNYAKAPTARSMPTCASRAATMAFAKALAAEGAPYNILVNGLVVGLIKSDQMTRNAKDEEDLKKRLADLGKRIPMGRVGEAEEFANIACFLASDQASYITGSAINIDGGMTPVV